VNIQSRVATIIDEDACIGCGACVQVCPKETISMVGETARITGTESLQCGHCEAVCPTGAVRVTTLSEAVLATETFATPTDWIAPGAADAATLMQLMRSRRSCRNYLDRPVPARMLRDLVRIAITAPSGTNSQSWTFTLVPKRARVVALGEAMLPFFERLNRRAEKGWLRGALKLAGKPELDIYYREIRTTVKEKIADWKENGRDFLFWHAPAVVVVATVPGASCPKEDALLAAQNLLLGAHAMGLGTCVIGYAAAAMNRDPAIQASIGMPPSETVHAVIAVGWPDETYHRLTGRKAPIVRTSG
jgi:nitroreductase/NAD-dependent dihydropyrimidine dehydrogenase PreA subunit